MADHPPVRVGCDVQSLVEVRESLARLGDSYLARLLSEAERAVAAELSGTEAVVRYLGGRFAAKEAVYKVLGGSPSSALGWPEIEVLADSNGAPTVVLHGAAARLAEASRLVGLSVSISHADPFAFAVAVGTAASEEN
ncbi:MAG TPA: holo-ACP synthase [Gryllotalpicola sp.]